MRVIAATKLLCGYDWPGNVRELCAEMRRLVRWTQAREYAAARDQLAREMFTRALNRCGGNVSKAAQELGMDRTGLSKAIKRVGVRL